MCVYIYVAMCASGALVVFAPALEKGVAHHPHPPPSLLLLGLLGLPVEAARPPAAPPRRARRGSHLPARPPGPGGIGGPGGRGGKDALCSLARPGSTAHAERPQTCAATCFEPRKPTDFSRNGTTETQLVQRKLSSTEGAQEPKTLFVFVQRNRHLKQSTAPLESQRNGHHTNPHVR